MPLYRRRNPYVTQNESRNFRPSWTAYLIFAAKLCVDFFRVVYRLLRGDLTVSRTLSRFQLNGRSYYVNLRKLSFPVLVAHRLNFRPTGKTKPLEDLISGSHSTTKPFSRVSPRPASTAATGFGSCLDCSEGWRIQKQFPPLPTTSMQLFIDTDSAYLSMTVACFNPTSSSSCLYYENKKNQPTTRSQARTSK